MADSFTDSLLEGLDGADLADLGSLLTSLLGSTATQNRAGTTDSATTAESEIDSEATKVTDVLGSLLEAIASSEVSNTNTTGVSSSTATTKGTITDAVSSEGAKESEGTQTSQLTVDQAGVDKLVADILGGTSGLSEVFSQQGAAGLYNSSVAAQASGNLIGNVAGEIAKLTGKQVVKSTEAENTVGSSISDKLQDIINTQNGTTSGTTSGSKNTTSNTTKDYTEGTTAAETQTKKQSQTEAGSVKSKDNVEGEDDGLINQIGNLLGL